ncbi:MAG TPA: hypothetical protein VHQ24_16400 [Lachnospiraceae bacterium]|nr:hypothetical protein [Lachnospiraceae bacterium]
MTITIGILVVTGIIGLIIGGNEVENHTIGNAITGLHELMMEGMMRNRTLMEGKVTVNDISAVTDELELDPLAEQTRLALVMATKNAHSMVNFSMWKLRLPSDSVIIDYPTNIPKGNGVTVFPKPEVEKPKVNINPPKVPEFTGFEYIPGSTEGNLEDIIKTAKGGKDKSKENEKSKENGKSKGDSKTEVEVPKNVQRQVKKLSPEAQKGYEKAIEGLKNGDMRGLNNHPLKGDRSGQWAVDIKGTGQNRGGGRIIYEITKDGVIKIVEIITGHTY